MNRSVDDAERSNEKSQALMNRAVDDAERSDEEERRS
jgi:hypothetical protein